MEQLTSTSWRVIRWLGGWAGMCLLALFTWIALSYGTWLALFISYNAVTYELLPTTPSIILAIFSALVWPVALGVAAKLDAI